MSIKEIRRKVMCTTDEGIACGPVSSTAIEGEVVVEDNGNTIYIHGQWIPEVSEEILVEAAKESIYDIYENMDSNSDEFDAMIEKIEDIRKTVIDERTAKDRYGAYIDELVAMIIEKIKGEGLYELITCGDDGEDEASAVDVQYYEK